MDGQYVINHGDVINGKLGTAFMKYKGRNIPVSWLKTVAGEHCNP